MSRVILCSRGKEPTAEDLKAVEDFREMILTVNDCKVCLRVDGKKRKAQWRVVSGGRWMIVAYCGRHADEVQLVGDDYLELI